MKGQLGVIVPTQHYIDAFNQLMPNFFSQRLNASSEDLVIGTPDMFRGISKELIIIAPLRNSKQSGLGLLDNKEYINLALTRSKFLWIIGSTSTIPQNSFWNKIAKKCIDLTKHSKHTNYIEFENKESIKREPRLDALKKVIKYEFDEERS